MVADHLHHSTGKPENPGDSRFAYPIASLLEAIVMIAVGLGVGWLALSENYSLLMQPKFRWLTVGGALAVLSMGVTGLFFPRKPGFAGPAAFLLLIGIVVIGRPFSEDSPASVTSALRLPDAENVEHPDFPMRDIRDLHMAMEEKDHDLNGLPLSAMGTVRSLPNPTGRRSVALMRSYMVCCAADAIAMGLRVPGEGIDRFQDGDWVVVRGRLTKLPEPSPVPPFRMGTATFSIVASDFIIEPAEIVPLVATLPSIVEQLSSQSTNRFMDALRSVDLLNELDKKGPFTVFAPVNEAYSESGTASVLQKGEDRIIQLSRHIVPGKFLERDLYEESVLRPIDGEPIAIQVDNGRLYLDSSRILLSNIEARNGVIHIIYPSLK